MVAYSVFMVNSAATPESALPPPRTPSESSAIPLPTEESSPPCPLCPFLAERFEVYRQIAYWKAMHQRARQREQKLQLRNAELEAQVRLQQQQIFGTKTEKQTATSEAQPQPDPAPRPKKPRGQQRGTTGHGRRDYSHLPEVVQERVLPQEQCQCCQCGKPFASAGTTEESTILEVEVKAHRRLIRRQRYRPTCDCPEQPKILTAPPAPRVIPKSIFGVSIWVTLLLDKYLFYRPTYRLLEDLRSHDLDLSLGSLTDGMAKLVPLFEPLYQACIAHSQEQDLWHADETRWQVFATIEGKVGYRWWLWVFHSADVVVFVLDSGRAHDVPETHLGSVEEGILVVDRYSAYKAIKPVKEGLILLAFCWAHVRRDFLAVGRGQPAQLEWALGWVERIGELYHLNDQRLQVQEEPEAFRRADADLREAITRMEQQATEELAQEQVPPEQRKVLESLQNHWEGLTLFVDRPWVPMDNNKAERAQRGPVVGRKNYYGSGAVWSGQLAAMLFGVFQTLSLWNLNARKWLTGYLEACAESGGRAPADAESYLPWNLDEARRMEWALEPDEIPQDTS